MLRERERPKHLSSPFLFRFSETFAITPCAMKGGFVYILASNSGVLYTGVTARLDVRLIQHRNAKPGTFTAKYNVNRLVYFERFGHIRAAIAREKQIKGWLRARRIALIERTNPGWHDLAGTVIPCGVY